MKILKIRSSAEGDRRVVIYQRPDGQSNSLFDSAERALREASARIQWLARELAWPAADAPPGEAAIRKDGYLHSAGGCLPV